MDLFDWLQNQLFPFLNSSSLLKTGKFQQNRTWDKMGYGCLSCTICTKTRYNCSDTTEWIFHSWWVIVRTSSWLMDTQTHRQTHTEAMTIPEGQNWPWVKLILFLHMSSFGSYIWCETMSTNNLAFFFLVIFIYFISNAWFNQQRSCQYSNPHCREKTNQFLDHLIPVLKILHW